MLLRQASRTLAAASRTATVSAGRPPIFAAPSASLASRVFPASAMNTSLRTYSDEQMKIMPFNSSVFKVEDMVVADHTEQVVAGGRDKFHLLHKGFEGVKQIGVIGWSSQGPAQAQNLRESLEGTGIKVSVGLRGGSASMDGARAAGFSESDGTLGEMWDVIDKSDMVILLISDAGQVEIFDKFMTRMKPGKVLGLSHGFLLGYAASAGKLDAIPKDIDIVAVCPKGMGPSVRRLYEQGKTVNGAGINASFAVHQDASGRATERALAWGVGVGSPYMFATTLVAEYRSDIYGERGVLLGGLHGIIENLMRFYQGEGVDAIEAYKRTGESLTGSVRKCISHAGMLKLYNDMSAADKAVFERGYSQAYSPLRDVLEEIYEDVASGREIGSVIDHCARFDRFPMRDVATTQTWKVAGQVREMRGSFEDKPDALAAGVYVACIVAQTDVLLKHGHSYSEIANESIIEGVDSLSPYLFARGVGYMIDNCSYTARLGARKWAPRFDYLLWQQANFKDGTADAKLIDEFKAHKIHPILAACSEYRPPVDISVQ